MWPGLRTASMIPRAFAYTSALAPSGTFGLAQAQDWPYPSRLSRLPVQVGCFP